MALKLDPNNTAATSASVKDAEGKRRREVERAADLLFSSYGDQALEKARRIEEGSVVPSFARSVTELIVHRLGARSR